MHGERVDGNDLDAVIEATGRLMNEARQERRPAVLEAMTYRYRGHSVADAGLSYRTREEIKEQQQQDPITRVREQLRAEDGLEDEDFDRIDEWAERRVREAVEFADASPLPDVDRLAAGMYAPGSVEQF